MRTQEIWHWNALGQIEEHLNLREKFKTTRPLPVIERTSLEQQTKQIESGFHDMFMTGVRSAVAQMLPRLDPLQNLQSQWFSHNGKLFDGEVVAVRRAIENRNPLCVFSPFALKQVAIVSGDPDTIRRLSGSLKDFYETHWVVGIGDFEGAGRSGSGVHFINTNNPEAFQSSVQKFLKASKAFFAVRST